VEEAVHIFLSEDEQTAFQQALEIGRLARIFTPKAREVETRLAEVVRLDCLGSDQNPVRGPARLQQGQGTPLLRARLQTGGAYAGTGLLRPPDHGSGAARVGLAPVALRAPSAKANTE